MKARHILITLIIILIKTEIKAQVNSFEIDSSNFRKELLPTLDSIYTNDQTVRIRFMELVKSKAPKVQIDSSENIMRQSDKLNLIKVNKIIADYGWLGPQDVGINGSQALFLVIQHADLATQQKYLPLIQKAEKDGKTLSSNLAILEDRVAMREGKKQIYGSQGFIDKATGKSYIYPVIDVDNLDKRRLSMSMPLMKDYVPNWDLEEYKKMLPKIEKMEKVQRVF